MKDQSKAEESLRQVSEDHVANDICDFVAGLVALRGTDEDPKLLTDEEHEQVGIKARFWFHVGRHQALVEIKDSLEKLNSSGLIVLPR